MAALAVPAIVGPLSFLTLGFPFFFTRLIPILYDHLADVLPYGERNHLGEPHDLG